MLWLRGEDRGQIDKGAKARAWRYTSGRDGRRWVSQRKVGGEG